MGINGRSTVGNHYRAVGFPINDFEDKKRFFQNLCNDNKDCTKAARGIYFRRKSEEGAELWMNVFYDSSQKCYLIGDLYPHYDGKTFHRVVLTEASKTGESHDMEGGYLAWMNPDKNEGSLENGDYQFFFGVPDFDRPETLELPRVAYLQLAAFAHKVKIFENENEFYSSQQNFELKDMGCMEKKPVKIAGKCFFPWGLINDPERKNPSSLPYVCLTGHVVDTEQKINSLTQNPYHWLLVETLGGKIDTVTDMECISKPIRKGNVVEIEAWLSGRIIGTE